MKVTQGKLKEREISLSTLLSYNFLPNYLKVILSTLSFYKEYEIEAYFMLKHQLPFLNNSNLNLYFYISPIFFLKHLSLELSQILPNLLNSTSLPLSPYLMYLASSISFVQSL